MSRLEVFAEDGTPLSQTDDGDAISQALATIGSDTRVSCVVVPGSALSISCPARS